MIGAIIAARGDDGIGGQIARFDRGDDVLRYLVRVMIEAGQGGFQTLSSSGIEVKQAAIGCLADCGGLVAIGSLCYRTAQAVAEFSANGNGIIGSPGIVNAGVDDRQCPRRDWRPLVRRAHLGQGDLVPVGDNGGASGRYFETECGDQQA
ncbi:MAG: hypothetical protein H7244_02765 [Herminiimonas sp.]|nr:hypothetical protein [Herminiimonas sp.]